MSDLAIDGSLRGKTKGLSLEERFWSKVEKSDGCWQWVGRISPQGYGHMWNGKTTTTAHRVAHELLVGPIPKGLTIDHLCRNRGCVNPAHLEAVTHQVNILRSDSAAARNAVKTHCPQGHEYSLENTRRRKDGSRGCRTCDNRR